MTRTKDHLRRLDNAECLRLLEGHPTRLGRIAFLDQGYPVVLPVNYRMYRGSVVFKSDPGSKLMACLTGQKVAFEVDHVNEAWHEGWSVLVQGSCQEITDPAHLSMLEQAGLEAWAGASMHVIELLQHRMSGRQIV